MKKPVSLLHRIKDLWPLYGIGATLCGAILLWGNLPKRLEHVEADQTKQGEELDDLKGWARELQGYTRAQEQLNQQQRQQMPDGGVLEGDFHAAPSIFFASKQSGHGVMKTRRAVRSSGLSRSNGWPVTLPSVR